MPPVVASAPASPNPEYPLWAGWDRKAEDALRGRLLRFLRGKRFRLLNEHDLEDAVQEALIGVFKSLEKRTILSREHFENTCRCAALQRAIDILRPKTKHPHDILENQRELPDSSPLAEAELACMTRAEMVRKAVEKLEPKEQRQVIQLLYFEGMKLDQIAETLGCPYGTAGRLHNHAKKQLAGLLSQAGIEGKLYVQQHNRNAKRQTSPTLSQPEGEQA